MTRWGLPLRNPSRPHGVPTRTYARDLLEVCWVGLVTSTLAVTHPLLGDVIVSGTVEAYVLPPNTPHTGASTVTELVALPYAKVVVNDDENLVDETDLAGVFSIATTFDPDTQVTVKVLLNRASYPPFNVENQSGSNVQLALTQQAGQPFAFTSVNGRAFNMQEEEFETAQVTSFYYLGLVTDFARDHSANWSDPYITPISVLECNKPVAPGTSCLQNVAGFVNARIHLFVDALAAARALWCMSAMRRNPRSSSTSILTISPNSVWHSPTS